MLKGYGVTHVFMVPAVLRRTFAEMERRTAIKRIHCHGEKSAAYMADGYARASGKPGGVHGAGDRCLKSAAGLRDAWLAHSPVIAFTGGRDPSSKFRKVYQEVDDVPAFEPVTKFNATGRRRRALPRHGAAGVSRRDHRHARPGASSSSAANEGQVDLDEPSSSRWSSSSSRACRRSALPR
jgi:acetolactate synthase-1/2/3 large subunit